MKTHGVLLVNLGTPDKPEKRAVRAYLREFLMDKRVINLAFPLRFFLVYCIIVPKRLDSVTRLYQQIWEQDSPIRSILFQQARELEKALNCDEEDGFLVEAAMTYGYPSIPDALEKLLNKKIDSLLVLPLYPQYSRTTTLPVKERMEKALKRKKFSAPLGLIDSYYDNPAYISALYEQISEHWQAQDCLPEVLLLSYHGIPRSYTEAGDPYISHCEQTTLSIKEALKEFPVRIEASYQSRLTSEEWAKPYTDESLEQLAKQGIKHVEVCCPGFSADCLETIDEIGVEYQALFLEKGGERFFAFPALNARPAHIKLMKEELVKALGRLSKT